MTQEIQEPDPSWTPAHVTPDHLRTLTPLVFDEDRDRSVPVADRAGTPSVATADAALSSCLTGETRLLATRADLPRSRPQRVLDGRTAHRLRRRGVHRRGCGHHRRRAGRRVNPRHTPRPAAPSCRVSPAADPAQAALFPVPVTTFRREVAYARPDDAPLTDADFTRLHAPARGGAL